MARKVAVTCSVCIAALVIIWAAPRILRETVYRTVSPHQQYKIEISQERPFPFYERAVYLNASHSGESVVRHKLLYTGDFLDNDFRDLYPNPRFRSDSIYELGDAGSNKRAGDLKILNQTSSRISYLLIETGWYKLVLLDVEPGAAIDLGFEYVGGLSCQGQYAESKERFAEAVGVVDGAEEGVRRQFTIRIKGGSATIESPQLRLRRTHCCASDRPDPEHELFY